MSYRRARTVTPPDPRRVVVPGRPGTIRLLCGALLVGVLSGGWFVSAEEAVAGPKEATAERVPDCTIRVDGTLDEMVWQTARAVTDFVQAEPEEGAEPTDRMEVRFAYDDSALYVGARMFSTDPVQAPLSRRDDGGQAESIQIELDTYFDRRTAYMFGVTAAGVRLDHYHATDNENRSDAEYDPVWQARTVMTDGEWTAELWLPFAQLRFNDRAERIFGLNIKRDIPAHNEETYWALVGRTESGWASRFGELRGIEGVEPRGRLEMLPYVSGSSRVTGDRDPSNPFDDGKNLGGARRGGHQVRAGIEPDARRGVQSRLWADRGGPGRGESHGVRDHFLRAPPVLSRREQRIDRRHRELLLLAADRRPPRRVRLGRLRGPPRDGDHPRRRQVDRPVVVWHLDRAAGGRDR